MRKLHYLAFIAVLFGTLSACNADVDHRDTPCDENLSKQAYQAFESDPELASLLTRLMGTLTHMHQFLHREIIKVVDKNLDSGNITPISTQDWRGRLAILSGFLRIAKEKAESVRLKGNDNISEITQTWAYLQELAQRCSTTIDDIIRTKDEQFTQKAKELSDLMNKIVSPDSGKVAAKIAALEDHLQNYQLSNIVNKILLELGDTDGAMELFKNSNFCGRQVNERVVHSIVRLGYRQCLNLKFVGDGVETQLLKQNCKLYVLNFVRALKDSRTPKNNLHQSCGLEAFYLEIIANSDLYDNYLVFEVALLGKEYDQYHSRITAYNVLSWLPPIVKFYALGERYPYLIKGSNCVEGEVCLKDFIAGFANEYEGRHATILMNDHYFKGDRYLKCRPLDNECFVQSNQNKLERGVYWQILLRPGDKFVIKNVDFNQYITKSGLVPLLEGHRGYFKTSFIQEEFESDYY